MKLTFVGTRGYIEPANRRHHFHTSLLVAYRGKRVMIDCGENLRRKLHQIHPDALVITHAHPDHLHGLKDTAPCPVHVARDAADPLRERGIEPHQLIQPRQPVTIHGIRFEAFTVEHSLRCPAVGYRVSAGRATLFYCPDVVFIHQRDEALSGARLYIGDGATLTRSLVRKRDDRLIGHTPVRTQLTWCQKCNVPRMAVTHCGSEIVAGDERRLKPRLRRMGHERGVEVFIAHDGRQLELR